MTSNLVVFLSFAVVALVCLVISIVLRILKYRYVSAIFELLTYASLVVFSFQFYTVFTELDDLTTTKVLEIIFMVFTLTLFIYKLIVFIRKKAL